jgi:ubiquinone/menaquinone biosynthesis C-methylase UbiE
MSERDLRSRRYWDKHATTYDTGMSRVERRYFPDTRPWICHQATGEVLEVAVGTGLNLPHYPSGVRLVGLDLSPSMLAVARERAPGADLRTGDAQNLPFPDSHFDTVVSTFSMCAIPDHRRAIREMARVLRPGGRLLLADHVVSTRWYGRAAQRLLDLFTVPYAGEHYRRRPLTEVEGLGFTVERHDRFTLGIFERFCARKPG